MYVVVEGFIKISNSKSLDCERTENRCESERGLFFVPREIFAMRVVQTYKPSEMVGCRVDGQTVTVGYGICQNFGYEFRTKISGTDY